MDRIIYIYKITNLINGKIYIGQTQNIDVRWRVHREKAKKKVNRYLYDAMNKYGDYNFKIEVIEECSYSERDKREIFWIEYYDSSNKDIGYNMTKGGGGGNTWSLNPNKEKTSEKLRTSNKGKKRSQAVRDKFKESWKNRKPYSEEFRKNVSEKISETLKRINAEGLLSYENNRMRGIKKEEHHLYVNVDIETLIKFLNLGLNNDIISEYFGCSNPTLIDRSKDLLGMTPSEYRKKNNIKRKMEKTKYETDKN